MMQTNILEQDRYRILLFDSTKTIPPQDVDFEREIQECRSKINPEPHVEFARRMRSPIPLQRQLCHFPTFTTPEHNRLFHPKQQSIPWKEVPEGCTDLWQKMIGEIQEDEKKERIPKKSKDERVRELEHLIAKKMKQKSLPIPSEPHHKSDSYEIRTVSTVEKPSFKLRHVPGLLHWLDQRGAWLSHRLPPAKIVQFRRIFHLLDEDDSDEISLDELYNALQLIDIALSKEELVKVARSLDVNFDGTINFDEFVRGMQDGAEWECLTEIYEQRVLREQQNLKSAKQTAKDRESISSKERLDRKALLPFAVWVPAWSRRKKVHGMMLEHQRRSAEAAQTSLTSTPQRRSTSSTTSVPAFKPFKTRDGHSRKTSTSSTASKNPHSMYVQKEEYDLYFAENDESVQLPNLKMHFVKRNTPDEENDETKQNKILSTLELELLESEQRYHNRDKRERNLQEKEDEISLVFLWRKTLERIQRRHADEEAIYDDKFEDKETLRKTEEEKKKLAIEEENERSRHCQRTCGCEHRSWKEKTRMQKVLEEREKLENHKVDIEHTRKSSKTPRTRATTPIERQNNATHSHTSSWSLSASVQKRLATPSQSAVRQKYTNSWI